jgi:hypothetical protein
MEPDAAQGGIAAVVVMLVLLILSWFFVFPAICRAIPLELPGLGIDFCVLFR